MSPFDAIRPQSWSSVLALLTPLLIALSASLAAIDRPLANAAAPHGIVSFELAGDAGRAAAILDSWSARQREGAAFVLGLDALYLLVYPAWLSLACALLGGHLGGGAGRALGAVAWGVLLAAPLDAVENAALLHGLWSGPSAGAARLAWACAVPKFALVALAAFALLVGAALAGSRRLRRAAG